MIGIARHKLIDHWRRREREQRNLSLLTSPQIDDPRNEIIEAQRAHEVLARLPAPQRSALVRRYLDGLPVADVAGHIGRSLHATETLLVRARATFRRIYTEGGVPPMTSDPFETLHVPLIAIRPRTEFMTDLQQRMHAVLDLPVSEGETEMTAETSARPSVQFALHYRDVNAALRWLEETLGLRAEWVHPTSGPVEHAGMRWGNGSISINYQRGIYELGPGAVILAVDSESELDALYRKVIDVGAKIARPMGPNWDRRSRNFVVRDPEGTLWELSGPDAE